MRSIWAAVFSDTVLSVWCADFCGSPTDPTGEHVRAYVRDRVRKWFSLRLDTLDTFAPDWLEGRCRTRFALNAISVANCCGPGQEIPWRERMSWVSFVRPTKPIVEEPNVRISNWIQILDFAWFAKRDKWQWFRRAAFGNAFWISFSFVFILPEIESQIFQRDEIYAGVTSCSIIFVYDLIISLFYYLNIFLPSFTILVSNRVKKNSLLNDFRFIKNCF